MEDEISLRDIADILAPQRAVLLGVPLLLAAIALGVVGAVPGTYASTVVLSVGTAPNSGSGESELLAAELLPGSAALASAYEQAAPARLAQRWRLDGRDLAPLLDVRVNDQSKAVNVVARASGDPEQARARAAAAASDFRNFVDERVSAALGAGLAAQLGQAKLSLSADRQVRQSLKALVEQTPQVLPGTGQASLRQNLSAQGLDPRFTGNSDQAASPAYALLSVRLAETEARLATTEAQVTRLQTLLRDRQQRLTVARQVVQVQVLNPASTPTKPVGPGRAVVTVLAFVLGLLLSVVWALLRHALRRDPAPRREPRTQPTPGD